jgi:hypothetical protein
MMIQYMDRNMSQSLIETNVNIGVVNAFLIIAVFTVNKFIFKVIQLAYNKRYTGTCPRQISVTADTRPVADFRCRGNESTVTLQHGQ